MAFDFHSDWDTYFNQQYENAKNYVLPFIGTYKNISNASVVLEIGCGEGVCVKSIYRQGL